MNSEIGQTSGRSARAGVKSKSTQSRRSYDDLAGSTLLRRSGKAAGLETPQRRDAASTILAARAKMEPDDRIGRQLRDFYRGLLAEPVPDRFTQLMSDLELGQLS